MTLLSRFRNILGGLFAMAAAAPVFAQEAPRLRAEVTVSGDVVRLRDVILNSGRFGDIAIFRSPDMGHTGAVPTWRIVEAAERAGLRGIDVGAISETLVTRAGRLVPLAEMEERVAASIARAIGVSESARIAVTFDRDVRPIAVEQESRGELVISRINHDVRGGRFEATFDIADSAIARRLGGFRVAGNASETVEIIVPARPINRGETIRASDLMIETRRRNEVGAIAADAVTMLIQAAGQAARRPLQAGRPFRAADLMKPELVERNGSILMLYELPGLALTMRGRALEAGAEGDVIQVQNTATRRTMQAIVTGPNKVTIQTRSRPVVVSTLPQTPN